MIFNNFELKGIPFFGLIFQNKNKDENIKFIYLLLGMVKRGILVHLRLRESDQ